MATFTTRLGLRKPDFSPGGDDYRVDLDLNANWDKIDNAISAYALSTTRPSTELYPGKLIWEADTGRVLALGDLGPPVIWYNVSANIVSVNDTNEITNPYFNQFLYHAIQQKFLRYNGTSWVQHSTLARRGGEYRTSATQSLPTGRTKLNFGTAIIAADGITWNGSNMFTVTEAGNYQMTTFCRVPVGSYTLGIGPNGYTGGVGSYSGEDAGSSSNEFQVSCNRWLNVGATICSYVYNNGSAQNLDHATRPAEFHVWRTQGGT